MIRLRPLQAQQKASPTAGDTYIGDTGMKAVSQGLSNIASMLSKHEQTAQASLADEAFTQKKSAFSNAYAAYEDALTRGNVEEIEQASSVVQKVYDSPLPTFVNEEESGGRLKNQAIISSYENRQARAFEPMMVKMPYQLNEAIILNKQLKKGKAFNTAATQFVIDNQNGGGASGLNSLLNDPYLVGTLDEEGNKVGGLSDSGGLTPEGVEQRNKGARATTLSATIEYLENTANPVEAKEAFDSFITYVDENPDLGYTPEEVAKLSDDFEKHYTNINTPENLSTQLKLELSDLSDKTKQLTSGTPNTGQAFELHNALLEFGDSYGPEIAKSKAMVEEYEGALFTSAFYMNPDIDNIGDNLSIAHVILNRAISTGLDESFDAASLLKDPLLIDIGANSANIATVTDWLNKSVTNIRRAVDNNDSSWIRRVSPRASVLYEKAMRGDQESRSELKLLYRDFVKSQKILGETLPPVFFIPTGDELPINATGQDMFEHVLKNVENNDPHSATQFYASMATSGATVQEATANLLGYVASNNMMEQGRRNGWDFSKINREEVAESVGLLTDIISRSNASPSVQENDVLDRMLEKGESSLARELRYYQTQGNGPLADTNRKLMLGIVRLVSSKDKVDIEDFGEVEKAYKEYELQVMSQHMGLTMQNDAGGSIKIPPVIFNKHIAPEPFKVLGVPIPNIIGKYSLNKMRPDMGAEYYSYTVALGFTDSTDLDMAAFYEEIARETDPEYFGKIGEPVYTPIGYVPSLPSDEDPTTGRSPEAVIASDRRFREAFMRGFFENEDDGFPMNRISDPVWVQTGSKQYEQRIYLEKWDGQSGYKAQTIQGKPVYTTLEFVDSIMNEARLREVDRFREEYVSRGFLGKDMRRNTVLDIYTEEILGRPDLSNALYRRRIGLHAVPVEMKPEPSEKDIAIIKKRERRDRQ